MNTLAYKAQNPIGCRTVMAGSATPLELDEKWLYEACRGARMRVPADDVIDTFLQQVRLLVMGGMALERARVQALRTLVERL